jgi:hypothetical protein
MIEFERKIKFYYITIYYSQLKFNLTFLVVY